MKLTRVCWPLKRPERLQMQTINLDSLVSVLSLYIRENQDKVLTGADSLSWQKWFSCQREGKLEFFWDAFVSSTWQQYWTMQLGNCTVAVLKFHRNQFEQTTCFFPMCRCPSNTCTYKVCFPELEDFSCFLHSCVYSQGSILSSLSQGAAEQLLQTVKGFASGYLMTCLALLLQQQ